jgi:pimeloyl-ACP methyl ester carboxylesterase
MIDGQTVHLEIRIYKPSTDAKALTLVFNHGSTGRGRAPSLFTQARDFP